MIRSSLLLCLLLIGALSCAPPNPGSDGPASGAQVTGIGESQFSRDELVMNAVLLHFLEDKAKDSWTFGRATGNVLLHIRNPKKTGILGQTELDIREHKLDAELLEALRKRNTARDWDSEPYSFEKFRLDPRVQIKDLWKDGKEPLDRFERFEGYKGYFEAFAPGFSKDGKRAVVRAWVGPSAHGCTVTYALEYRGDKWTVLWREYAFYA